MNEERIKELFSNEEYVKGLFELGSYEAASAKLKEDGVEISPDELRNVVDFAKKRQNDELSDEDLESVNGGILFIGIMVAAAFIGCGTMTGVLLGTKSCK